jgi:hypothetical protein
VERACTSSRASTSAYRFPSEIAETALAHTVGTAVIEAYRRTDLFAKRRELAEAWARYCAGGAEVTNFPAGAVGVGQLMADLTEPERLIRTSPRSTKPAPDDLDVAFAPQPTLRRINRSRLVGSALRSDVIALSHRSKRFQ